MEAQIKMEVAAGQGDQAILDLTYMEREFVKKYEKLPQLWQKDHPDYCNKYKRNIAYDSLLPILRKHLPTANRINVRQKINVLRSTYRKELRKYLASKTITSDGEIIYTHIPPSWKFKAMKFLQDLGDIKTEVPQSEIVIEETVEDDSFNELEEQELVYIQDPDSATEDQEATQELISIEESEHSPIYVEHKKTPVKSSRKRSKFSEAYIIDRECTAIGSNVTCKLQRMTVDQRYYAEQLINKVLMSGLRRALSAETDFADYIIQKTEFQGLNCTR